MALKFILKFGKLSQFYCEVPAYNGYQFHVNGKKIRSITNCFKTITYCQKQRLSIVSQDILEKLQQIVGSKNVSTSLAVREQYSKDESPHSSLPADVVVFPQTTEEVSQIARICYSKSIPMIPHGTGTGLEHGVGAPQGGVCVDLSQMTAVVNVNSEDFDATVEPGVTWRALNQYLKDTGLMFPVDPGADASLGGMSATSASGTNAVRYGTMKENVLNLEVVLADGTILHTSGKGRRSRKSSAGYNLTSLFVGSEGTLGFITKITLRLHGIPETMASAVCSFPTVKNAVDSVIQTLQCSIPVARIELLDELAMDTCNKYSNLDYAPSPSLFLEFHGSEEEVQMQAEFVEKIAIENGGSNFLWARDTETRNKLWKARHQLYYAVLALKPGNKCITTDACVPISKLTEMITKTKDDIKNSGITGAILGHVGDGNFHSLLLFDPENNEEFLAAKALSIKMAERALSLEGTCTGEHGIGVGKIELLEKEYGAAGIKVMQQIKLALDPKGLMNPGKVLKMYKL